MKNVLLVDDDSIANFISTKLLQDTGISNIQTAFNGREAIALINDNVSMPDVILLDLNMPIMDGFDFLEAFHDIKRLDKVNAKIIVLTSSDDPKDKIKAKQLGAADYLTKPLLRESLLMAIQN